MDRSRLALALPLAALFVTFFVAPLCVLVTVSLSSDATPGAWTFSNYAKLFGDRFNYSILFDTLLLGLKATAVCFLFGFPVAWIASRARPLWQSLILFAVILPIMTSVVVRTFAWIVIFGRQGVINQIVMGLGLTDEPLRLLFSEAGVVIVLAQVQMPLMVLPILSILAKIDPNLSDASRALGAGEWRTLWKVTLPLSLSGILAGWILTYAACVTAFVTQSLIGGARLIYMPLHIYQQAVGANNWPFAAAISIIFMIAVLCVVTLLNFLAAASQRHAQI